MPQKMQNFSDLWSVKTEIVIRFLCLFSLLLLLHCICCFWQHPHNISNEIKRKRKKNLWMLPETETSSLHATFMPMQHSQGFFCIFFHFICLTQHVSIDHQHINNRSNNSSNNTIIISSKSGSSSSISVAKMIKKSQHVF